MSRPTDELGSLTSRFISEPGPRRVMARSTSTPRANDVAGITLHATTNQLPATQEGNLYGYINSVLDYTGMFRTNGHSGTLSIRARPSQCPLSPRAIFRIWARTARCLSSARRASRRSRRPMPIPSTSTSRRTHLCGFDATTSRLRSRRVDTFITTLRRGTARADLSSDSQSWWIYSASGFYFERIGMDFDGSIVYNPSLTLPHASIHPKSAH